MTPLAQFIGMSDPKPQSPREHSVELRTSEICELRWDDIDLRAAAMHVKRLKHGQDRHMGSAPSAASICAST